jgi:arginine deiminase
MVDAIEAHMESASPVDLAEMLIAGLTRSELTEMVGELDSLVLSTLGPDDFVLAPLPNHLFTRDTSCWVYDGVAINSMRKSARMRETINYEAIYRWHPMFANGEHQVWSQGRGGAGWALGTHLTPGRRAFGGQPVRQGFSRSRGGRFAAEGSGVHAPGYGHDDGR